MKTPYDWDLHTVPQPGLGVRELYWPRGHCLGGSSSINAMMWVRGHRGRLRHTWARSAGDDWSLDTLVRYFRRAEQWTGPTGDSTVHGTEGPLFISRPGARAR
ncbi:GMC family oxidoreductase N-terminal domain-containing protein [Streptomyces sp. NPDC006261]|uniref:GMC family oxidoreductase N-terminal domain-containing protein n=1 Tax=Streptomyces sp. NPDC006261 TaxID=3156739 RepID=UPI0033B56D80